MRIVDIFKTTRIIPNQIGSCGIEVGVRMPYFGDLCAILPVKIPYLQKSGRSFTPDDP